MQITHHKPAARGVNQLMYVGDVVDPPTVSPLTVAIVLALGWFLLGRR